MSGRAPSNYNYDPRRGSSTRPANGYGQGQGQGSTRQGQGQSSRTPQSYAMTEYLKTAHRHETWDWEKKAKDRNDKNQRL
ncbi:hypothetical protein T069G_00115 [Trichoderma breve]|uniref:Uncharacterized protein n=1 Tax=Trichoderma breve TaxID=2034170 RepID=A0A9W9EBD1_9HYPO|nr:hypothetical protein T069G_00115 [Trichoderma breve]KAJ4863585.1 hypothetical protein T069G_00115 [Trichoderma breve]